MKRKYIGIIIGSVLLVTALGVYIALGSLNQNPFDKEANQYNNASTAGVESNSSQKISGDENPFGEKVSTPLSEGLMQQYIHAMSHQKVEADEKWSFFEITDDRIDFLLSQLEVSKYKHEHTYKEILISWKDGDFSEAVNHHNAVWRIQEGTVGLATGLLSSKEEESYIKSRKKESR